MEPASVDAKLAEVTVYASGARVRRVTTVNGGLSRVRIGGLPVTVIDDTVRIEVDGPAIATGVRVAVDTPPITEAASEDAPAVRAARRQVAIGTAEVERLQAALAALAQASIVQPDPGKDPAPWSAVVAARRTIVALRAERELLLRGQLAAARRALDDAHRALAAELDRDQRAGTTRAPKLHELRKHVELELVATGAGPLTIHLEYLVSAARWAPSYVARLDGDRASVELRAVVAQASGEDWAGVPLRLSTAEPARFAALPELAAQRIGRRQQEPARAGFRAPPVGAQALFADYDRDRATTTGARPPVRKPQPITETITDALYVGRPPAAPPPPPAAMPYGGLAGEVWDDESAGAKEAFRTPAGGAAALVPPTFAAPAPQKSEAPMRKRAAGREAAADQPPLVTPEPTPRLDYGGLVMAPPTSPARGTLIPAERDPRAASIDGEITVAHARLVALPLPPGCRADWAHTYDHAFVTDGAVDVRADGTWHAIAVTAHAATATVKHVSVPREQADVFRVATITLASPEIAKPFVGPLLPGPIDVYDHGRFLVTSDVDYTPPGATVEIGLGVDPAVKIARNAEFREEAAGMLRGAIRLHHTIAIDVDNLSGRGIDLEVRERIPVVREGDDEVAVTLKSIEPAWERWSPDAEGPRARRLRGGFRWRLAVPAGQKRTLRAGYEVKIAAKHELVGGNRREP